MLTLTVADVSGDASKKSDTEDTFAYGGKIYGITISGKKKTDDIRETKYEYDGKNQLVAFTDPEGRRQTYTYDVNSNLTKTVDKNGNTQKNTYDYQNRLTAIKNQTRSEDISYSSDSNNNGKQIKRINFARYSK